MEVNEATVETEGLPPRHLLPQGLSDVVEAGVPAIGIDLYIVEVEREHLVVRA